MKTLRQRRVRIERRFAFLQSIAGWSTESENKSRYARLLKDEAELMVDEAMAHLQRHFRAQDVLDRYWLLLQHFDQLSPGQREVYWQRIKRQQDALLHDYEEGV
jgi:hypothetical protein